MKLIDHLLGGNACYGGLVGTKPGNQESCDLAVVLASLQFAVKSSKLKLILPCCVMSLFLSYIKVLCACLSMPNVFVLASIVFFLPAAFEGAEVVFHMAAPDSSINSFHLHYSVNVEGL
jgi:hypothetical protein